MNRIDSAQNAHLRWVKSLIKDAATRRAEGLCVLEGAHLCLSYRELGNKPMYVLIDADRQADPDCLIAVQGLEPQRCALVPSALMSRCSSLNTSPGILFVVKTPVLPPLLATPTHAVMLDRIQDPGNLGTLIRNCVAFGVPDLLLSKGCASAWAPKVLRAAQGAHFSLRIHEECELIALVKAAQTPVIATVLHEALPLMDTALPPQAIWMFGNEGGGLDDALTQMASLRLTLPLPEGVESLNVGVFSALCLYEQGRQHSQPRKLQ